MIDTGGYFAMGGYGVFVWGAYGAALIIIGGMGLVSWLRLRRVTRAREHDKFGERS